MYQKCSVAFITSLTCSCVCGRPVIVLLSFDRLNRFILVFVLFVSVFFFCNRVSVVSDVLVSSSHTVLRLILNVGDKKCVQSLRGIMADDSCSSAHSCLYLLK